MHIPQGSAGQVPDQIGLAPAISPTCDSMLRGGVVKVGKGPTICTYLQDLWELEELREESGNIMGRVQRLFGDVAFKSAPVFFEISAILQTSMLQAMRLLCVTPNSLVVDGAWLGVNGRDERGVSKNALGQLNGTGRSDDMI